MEVTKKRIRTNCHKGQTFAQITLDDDFNVPDVRPDMEKIIKEQGTVSITEVRVMDGKVCVRGVLKFDVLYGCVNGPCPVHHMEGSLSFEEYVPMEKVNGGDDVKVRWDMEDLRTHMINSRKLGLRAVVSLTLTADCVMEIEAIDHLKDDDKVCTRMQQVNTSQIHTRKKDTFRIREEISLPFHCATPGY